MSKRWQALIIPSTGATHFATWFLNKYAASLREGDEWRLLLFIPNGRYSYYLKRLAQHGLKPVTLGFEHGNYNYSIELVKEANHG